jgi:cytochrome b6
MSAAHRLRQAGEFLGLRFPVEKLNYEAMVLKKDVPVHRLSWGYYMGGLALFFLIVQVATGLMLLFYYQPTVSDAHASVEYLTAHVPGGALVRNIHSWSSSLMIASVFVHLLTAFAMKAFAPPREITWLTGVALFGVTLVFGFTGYLLPWHQIAVNATKIGLQTIEELGRYLPGELSTLPRAVKETIQGEATVGQATLSRFFSLHVIILPLLTAMILGLHLLSIQLHGMSAGVDEPPKRKEKFFPVFFLKDLSLWGLAFMGLFILGMCLPFESLFPYPLFEPYNAKGSTPDGIKPEWYFFWIYYPLEMLPFWVILVGQMALGVVLAGAPWIFRHTSRRTMRLLALLGALYLVVMTLFGEQIYHLVKGGAP